MPQSFAHIIDIKVSVVRRPYTCKRKTFSEHFKNFLLTFEMLAESS